MAEHGVVAASQFKLLLSISNYAESELEALFSKGDTYLSAEEAVEAGLVDAVVGKIRDIHPQWATTAVGEDTQKTKLK